MHWPNSGYLASGGLKSARVPLLANSQDLPPSSLRRQPTAEIPTHMRFGLVRSGTMEWRHIPPKPGCHLSRLGCDSRPAFSSHVSPRSWLVHRLAGSTPAYTMSGSFSRPGCTIQTFSSLRPLSSGNFMPSEGSFHVSPKSSLYFTNEPKNPWFSAAYMRGEDRWSSIPL